MNGRAPTGARHDEAERERAAARLRQRLWGATVLIAIAVIVLPVLLDGAGSESQFRRVERLREEPPRIVSGNDPAAAEAASARPRPTLRDVVESMDSSSSEASASGDAGDAGDTAADGRAGEGAGAGAGDSTTPGVDVGADVGADAGATAGATAGAGLSVTADPGADPAVVLPVETVSAELDFAMPESALAGSAGAIAAGREAVGPDGLATGRDLPRDAARELAVVLPDQLAGELAEVLPEAAALELASEIATEMGTGARVGVADDGGERAAGRSSVDGASRATGDRLAEDPVRAWVVQAGSFRQQANAVAVRDRLRRAGHPTFITDARAGEATLYRVRVGPMIDEVMAQGLRDEVIELLGREAIVVAYP